MRPQKKVELWEENNHGISFGRDAPCVFVMLTNAYNQKNLKFKADCLPCEKARVSVRLRLSNVISIMQAQAKQELYPNHH